MGRIRLTLSIVFGHGRETTTREERDEGRMRKEEREGLKKEEKKRIMQGKINETEN